MVKKTLLFDTISEETQSKLGVTKEDINLSEGSVHMLKLTEKDGIVLQDKDKIRGYRPKMVVIVANKDDSYYATALINSTPNKNKLKKEEIEKDFYPLRMKDYSFIDADHDPSYIDCGQLFSFCKNRILRENDYRGSISPSEIPAVLSKVRNSERIEVIDLIDYGLIDG